MATTAFRRSILFVLPLVLLLAAFPLWYAGLAAAPQIHVGATGQEALPGIVQTTVITDSRGQVMELRTITIPVSQEHHSDHDWSTPGTQEIFVRVATSWEQELTRVDPPGPDEKGWIRCAILFFRDFVARYQVWQYTHTSTGGVMRGDLLWWHASGEAVYGIPNYSGKTFGSSLPNDMRGDPDYYIKETDCWNLPPPGSLLVQ